MLAPLCAVIFGVLGCIGIFQVVIKILYDGAKIQQPKTIKLYLLCGVVALLIIFSYMQAFNWPEILILILPILVLLHFVYLLRGYLFEDRS